MVRNTAQAGFTLDELGWQLMPVPRHADWYGLTGFFLATPEANPPIMQDGAIMISHKAAMTV